MNPILRSMQQQQQAQRKNPPQNQRRPNNKGAKKETRRPPPPIRHSTMVLPTMPAPTLSHIRTEYAEPANYDTRLTHLSQLFPNIDSPVIMDILRQNRGNIEAATRDLFQLTNPTSIDTVPQHTNPLLDSFELPPCYDDLEEGYQFSTDSIDKKASLPVISRGKSIEEPNIKRQPQHAELKRFKTTVGLIRPRENKDYLLKWKKGETCWLTVNGKKILIGPLPDDFLRIKKPPPVRTQSLPNTNTVFSPINHPPPPLTVGPTDEISRAREGRISPFRLPLRLEELDIPPDPADTEAQLYEDRKLANYLQNVEFLQQVKQNQDLYTQLRLAANIDTGVAGSQTPLHSQATLKRMDKATKKKLTKLAKKLQKESSP